MFMEVNKMKYKNGTKVRLTEEHDSLDVGAEGIIRGIHKSTGDYALKITKNIGSAPLHDCDKIFSEDVGYYVDVDRVVRIGKAGKVKPEDMTRYMVFGTGCNNKSELMETEAEVKKEIKRVSKDSSWTGRIIAYELVPLYEAEKKVVLKTFKKVTVKKVKK